MDVQTTYSPQQEISPVRPDVPEETIAQLGVSLFDSIETALSQRKTMDETLDYWNDMYEMNTGQRNTPWMNASSLCVPIVALNMEAVQSRLTTAVFVPRFYVVNGNTTAATASQHEVERFYNAEFYKRGWLFPHLECLHLSLRDGVSVMEILWKYKEITRPVVVWEDETVIGPDGVAIPAYGPDGKPKKKKTFRKAKIIEHNGVALRAVELRDFLMIPSAATDIQTAPACAAKLYLTEVDIRELVASGTFDEDAAERCINYLSYGQTELPQDEQGVATYEQGGTIQVGDEGNMDPGGDTRMRGALEIWRVHSRQYDLDGDGIAEENVFWVHHLSQTLLGWGPYEYWHGKRPFVKCAPMPRPKRFQGFSVPERLRSYQEEANARHNQRSDLLDITLSPPLWYTAGAKIADKDGMWGPGVRYEVSSKDDIGLLQLGTVDPASFQEESLQYSFAAKMVGIESPSLPLPGGAKVPNKVLQANATGSNVRLDLMALYVRQFCKEVIDQIHQLNLQYGDDEMLGPEGIGLQTTVPDENGNAAEKFKIPAQVLAEDYTLDVAGNQGALDKDNKRQDSMQLYALLMQNPLVQGDMARVWSVTRLALDEFNRPDVTALIGTLEEAQEKGQQMAAAAKAKHDEDMQLQLLSHSKNPSPASKGPEGPPPMTPNGAPPNGAPPPTPAG